VRRALIVIGALVASGVLVVVLAPVHLGGASAAAAGSTLAPTAGDAIQPELGVPANEVVAIGTSPGEESGEVWAYGKLGSAPASVAGGSYAGPYALLERSTSSTEGNYPSSWHVVPLPTSGPAGEPLGGSPAPYGAFAGQTTFNGGVVLLDSGEHILVRDPSGEFKAIGAPTPTSEPSKELLGAKESLLPPKAAGNVPYAAIEDEDEKGAARTGVLIAPFHDGYTTGLPLGVLHYDGENWSREPIRVEGEEELKEFDGLAMSCAGTSAAPDASSPQNCWLFASAQVKARHEEAEHPALLLYRRVAKESKVTKESTYEWVRESGPGVLDEGTGANVEKLPATAQMLTATAQGAWVDFEEGGTRTVSQFVEPTGSGLKVFGAWCYPTTSSCKQSLGARLGGAYRSFAWPGSGEEIGTRIITGLANRAMLEFAGGNFTYQVGVGGTAGEASGAAAFEPPTAGAPQEGWIADDVITDRAIDGAGQAPVIKLTHSPAGDQLGEEAVPFRRPLLAVAQAPGTTPGDPNAEALAVGEQGEIAHYVPGSGWHSENLYSSAGEAETSHTLRGVAWPEPGRAYAVGDNGTMWVWLASTGLWEPDPAKLPNFIGNLQAIAFEPGHPDVGYAVGRQGVLLQFGKSWEQVPLPTELQQANFTSITFAGGVAYATYRKLAVPEGGTEFNAFETGGVAVEEDANGPEAGEHWHVDPGASALLGQLPESERVLSQIAGLPDGGEGVVAAGPGKVIECESECGTGPPGGASHWHFSAQPLPEAENVSALAAYRDGTGALRAIVSIDLDYELDPQNFAGGDLRTTPFGIDVPAPEAAGQPPTLLGPDLLPDAGYLLKETPNGWEDMEHAALPVTTISAEMPARPDPVLALLVSPTGEQGLAVGGQTGDIKGTSGIGGKNFHYQTAAAERFPAGSAAKNGANPAPVSTTSGDASFAIAGQAACTQEECADFAAEDTGPDADLENALKSANSIAQNHRGGLQGFLYTGGRLPGGPTAKTQEALERFEGALGSFGQLLGSGGPLPVYMAASEELTSAGEAPFSQELGAFTPGAPPGHAYYSMTSRGAGGEVQVIGLSFANEELEAEEQGWLIDELGNARGRKIPAIVIGNDSLGFVLPGEGASSAKKGVRSAKDASVISQILTEGGASAYFFDYPGANVQTSISYGARTIPAYGTGTLGYVNTSDESVETESLGSSGFLLAEVETAVRNPASNIAPVNVRIVPNIAQLALDAVNGTFLRRSQAALFEALARRPVAGVAFEEGNQGFELSGPDPYDKIPFNCLGSNCADEVPEEYTFTSSNPEVGGFVEHNPAERSPLAVLPNANHLPIPDEPRNGKGELNPEDKYSRENPTGPPGKRYPINERGEILPYHQANPEEEPRLASQSVVFCAYNHGTTMVSVTTGGLTYSEPVTVQPGTVEYPCGTIPLKNPPSRQVLEPGGSSFPTPNLETTRPSHPGPLIPAVHIPVPPAPKPASPPAPKKAEHKPAPPFTFAPVQLVPLLAFVPPPPPPAARPTPPSGTAEVPAQSPVSQTVGIEEQEEEHQSATEHVHNMAAYSDSDQGPIPSWPLALIPIVLAAAVAVRPGSRSRERVYVQETTREPARRL
jgi:hypothetical protein